jgi:iron complex outermembrane receptor protein
MSLEHNPYTGTELLPQLRVAWSPAASVWLWGSLSRAVRAPSRIDRELYQPAEPPHALAGGPDFASEVSHVLELGLRAQPDPALSFGFTLFRHEHHGLRSLALTPEGAQFRNDIDGHSQGVQGWASWRALPAWRLDAGLVVLDQALRVRAGRTDLGGINALGNDPPYWASLRSSLDLGDTWRWQVQVRHVGDRPMPEVPAYTAVDTRVAWSPRPEMEAALAVRNATDPSHPEWGTAASRVELRRQVELQWRWAW